MSAIEAKAVEARFIPMRRSGSTVSAGAHSSDGWQVDSPWHTHDMHQLLYAMEGSVEVDGGGARYVVPRQFAVWIPAGTAHRTVIQRVRSGSVFLSPEMVAWRSNALRVIAAPRLLREMVIHAMRWPLDRTDDAGSTAFFLCFAHLCEEWLVKDVKLVLPTSTDPRIAAAMAATRSHVAKVRLRDVCRAASLSERSLRRRFRLAAGMSWEAYRLRVRIALAIEALDATRKSIKQIAADVGYEDPAAFTRAFRSMMGVSPVEYRR